MSEQEQSLLRLAEHLTYQTLRMGGRCELSSWQDLMPPHDRCAESVVALRWESGFADEVCERHAESARERGALVVYSRRADGTVTTPDAVAEGGQR